MMLFLIIFLLWTIRNYIIKNIIVHFLLSMSILVIDYFYIFLIKLAEIYYYFFTIDVGIVLFFSIFPILINEFINFFIYHITFLKLCCIYKKIKVKYLTKYYLKIWMIQNIFVYIFKYIIYVYYFIYTLFLLCFDFTICINIFYSNTNYLESIFNESCLYEELFDAQNDDTHQKVLNRLDDNVNVFSLKNRPWLKIIITNFNNMIEISFKLGNSVWTPVFINGQWNEELNSENLILMFIKDYCFNEDFIKYHLSSSKKVCIIYDYFSESNYNHKWTQVSIIDTTFADMIKKNNIKVNDTNSYFNEKNTNEIKYDNKNYDVTRRGLSFYNRILLNPKSPDCLVAPEFLKEVFVRNFQNINIENNLLENDSRDTQIDQAKIYAKELLAEQRLRAKNDALDKRSYINVIKQIEYVYKISVAENDPNKFWQISSLWEELDSLHAESHRLVEEYYEINELNTEGFILRGLVLTPDNINESGLYYSTV